MYVYILAINSSDVNPQLIDGNARLNVFGRTKHSLFFNPKSVCHTCF